MIRYLPQWWWLQFETVVAEIRLRNNFRLLHLPLGEEPAEGLGDDPDVEEGGQGGDVESQLNVAPVLHVLGNQGKDNDP